MYTLRGSAATIGELTAGVELAGVRRTLVEVCGPTPS